MTQTIEEPRQPHLLNFQYRLYPTAIQERQMFHILWENKTQWNEATANYQAAVKNLHRGNLAYLWKQFLGMDKLDTQVNRRLAIERTGAQYPEVPREQWSRLYDLRNILGKNIPLDLRYLDLDFLILESERQYALELPLLRPYWRQVKRWYKHIGRLKKLIRENPTLQKTIKKPPRPPAPKADQVPWHYALKNAAKHWAGFAAKQAMDARYPTASQVSRAEIRFDISGSGKSKFLRCCTPSTAQRKNGHPGLPQFKPFRKVTSFGYPLQKSPLRSTRKHIQLSIKGLPAGMEWVTLQLHRPIPPSAKFRSARICHKSEGWYVVFALALDDQDYFLPTANPDWMVGADPGASTALTTVAIDTSTGEIVSRKFDWRPLETNAEKLAILQQRMAGMATPDRRKGRQGSHRWKKVAAQVSRLHARIRRQRQSQHHQVSRYLVQHGYIAIGAWEPPRVKKDAPGPQGIKKRRRGGRDRGMATLRQMVEEKGERAQAISVIAYANECNSTRQCSVCRKLTGPQQDLSVRKWTCAQCGAHHDRDINAATNIVQMAFEGNQENKD